jgi:hypothetical protein
MIGTIPMTSAFGAKSSHRLCLLLATALGLLRFSFDLHSGCRERRLSIAIGAIGFDDLQPIGIGDPRWKAGQLGEELVGRFGEHLLDVMLVAQSKDTACVAGGKVQNRLAQANDDVLGLANDQRATD